MEVIDDEYRRFRRGGKETHNQERGEDLKRIAKLSQLAAKLLNRALCCEDKK